MKVNIDINKLTADAKDFSEKLRQLSMMPIDDNRFQSAIKKSAQPLANIEQQEFDAIKKTNWRGSVNMQFGVKTSRKTNNVYVGPLALPGTGWQTFFFLNYGFMHHGGRYHNGNPTFVQVPGNHFKERAFQKGVTYVTDAMDSNIRKLMKQFAKERGLRVD
jgi:hypothetical protein